MTRRASGRVEGVVQGVGFRPYVYRLAREEGLAGYVLNDERGVLLDVEGDCDGGRALRGPAAGRGAAAGGDRVGRVGVAAADRGARASASSRAPAAASPTRRSPPTPRPAPHCLAELLDPADRRYRYPFVNCTDCGPRFTIVRGVPYDRPLTTMAGFAMCRALPGGVRRPGRPPLPRAAQRVPGLRADRAARGRDGRRRDAPGRGGAARRRDRGRQGPGRLPPRVPRRRRARRSRGCARASTARTGRSRSWRATSRRRGRWSSWGRPRRALLAGHERPIVLARAARRRARGGGGRAAQRRARRDAALLAAAPPAARTTPRRRS